MEIKVKSPVIHNADGTAYLYDIALDVLNRAMASLDPSFVFV